MHHTYTHILTPIHTRTHRYTLTRSYNTPTLTVSHPYIHIHTKTHTDMFIEHAYTHSLAPKHTHTHTDTQ